MLRIGFVVLSLGSVAGVIDTVMFYPAAASAGGSWPE